MPGSPDDDEVRWFGMFRSVGVSRLDEDRCRAFRKEQWSRARNAAFFLAASVAGWVLLVGLTKWDLGIALGPSLLFRPLLSTWTSFRYLRSVRPDSYVEFFEGRVPKVQWFRDNLTKKLVSGSLVGTKSIHRLTVHVATGLLLEVDGALVPPFAGEVVATAPVPLPGSTLPAVGDRRPLTVIEAQELQGILAHRARFSWAWSVVAAALLGLVVWWLATAAELDGSAPFYALSVGFITLLAIARSLAFQSAQGVRARAEADIAGGLVRGPSTWRLPVLDTVWERDGRPSVERLERGGLTGKKRALERPQTF